MWLSADGFDDRERPMNLDEVRAEFSGPVFRLEPTDQYELAAVGTSRRDGRLTGASLSYFDRTRHATGPEPPAWSGAQEWMAEWLRRLGQHPLVSEVVRVWTLEEFGGAKATELAMLNLHLDFVLTNELQSESQERPPSRKSGSALVLDGAPVPGLVAESAQLTGAAARIDDVLVSVVVLGFLSWPAKPGLISR